MKNAELLDELEEKFNALKEELEFESSLEEIDEIFLIKDHILGEGFVSESLSRQICLRIVDLYRGWTGYLHGLIMPNPQNILNMSEAKIFDQNEKKEISELMKKTMEISSRNSLISITRDKEEEAKFIDDCVNFWNDIFSVKLSEFLRKANNEWSNEE